MTLTIHLGTYKTATTSLQKLLKDKKEHLHSLGYDVYAGTFDRDYSTIKTFHAYLKGKKSKREFIDCFYEAYLKGSNNNKIISDEMLLGHLQKGPALYGNNINKFVSALDDINIPYKIVFVIRRIDLLLESLYVHNVGVNFTRKSFDEFYEKLDFGMCQWSLVLNEFEMGKNITEISVLPFEICLHNSDFYVDNVMAALGLPRLEWGKLPRENVSIGGKGHVVIQSLNALSENNIISKDDNRHLTKLVYDHFINSGDSKVDFFGKFRKILIEYYRTDNEDVSRRYFNNIPDQYFQRLFGDAANKVFDRRIVPVGYGGVRCERIG